MAVFPGGICYDSFEHILKPIGKNRFRVGEDEVCPETVVFECMQDGKALIARYSGCPFYRTSTSSV